MYFSVDLHVYFSVGIHVYFSGVTTTLICISNAETKQTFIISIHYKQLNSLVTILW